MEHEEHCNRCDHLLDEHFYCEECGAYDEEEDEDDYDEEDDDDEDDEDDN